MGKTVLLGIDGATFDVLDPFMNNGVMPHLDGLVSRGTRAPLRTIMPPLTPPAWTSLMTGKRPGRHGVFDFFQRESPVSEYLRLSTSQDIQTPTVWSLASRSGKKVISLNFPLMFPPPDVNGAVVPGGWMPWRQLRLGCHPAGLFDRLKALPSFDPKELSLDMELEAKAIEGCPADEYADWIKLHTRREERWLEILRYLLEDMSGADLVGVMFDGVDKLQHLCWRFIDPACRPENPTDWESEVIDLCEQYFRRLDDRIGEIIHMAGPDATVVVASDHGFGPTWDVFYVNRWLEQEGFLHWAEPSDSADTHSTNGAAASSDALKVGFAAMARHITELDWSKTVAYAATPSSQGINVVVNEPGTDSRLSPDRYAEIRTAVAEKLRHVQNPHTGEPLVREVVTREQAFAGPFQDTAPDLSMVLADGAAISILPSDEIVRRRAEVNGNHRFDGTFIAAGPGIRAGLAIDRVDIIDVTPLLLHSLGLSIPDDLDGVVPVDIFFESSLAQHPPRFEVAERGAAPALADSASFDGEEEELVLTRLRALGYVE